MLEQLITLIQGREISFLQAKTRCLWSPASITQTRFYAEMMFTKSDFCRKLTGYWCACKMYVYCICLQMLYWIQPIKDHACNFFPMLILILHFAMWFGFFSHSAVAHNSIFFLDLLRASVSGPQAGFSWFHWRLYWSTDADHNAKHDWNLFGQKLVKNWLKFLLVAVKL